ncbi:4-hydroxy-tetrahydrodipicolinate synthase [Hoeflea prorocentri]|uniref:4-hydroxy-tetrahydrodipicolinate synthase n=1 Tax=Hoeflea prorocentri TaxID=1922333 RepID=A0A9X3ZKC1_9HYPH|nr:4-hydroxy-tetrahydrodipicolinate synthase [Hoeflea prorocentri]MCY6383745.1 4-hydroxy-tetrahydrodipicolinate synthase [Hoeflea prorocentri]MDA5401545.1 4-hydroxy-tetrahydrodipicolinate synthase [Hoeflea prorocentri]
MTALVTPFDKHSDVDEGALRALCRRQKQAGVGGFVPVGGTGEYPALSNAERARVVEIVSHEASGSIPVLAGVLPAGFEDAVEIGRLLRDAGADALMLLTPHYAPATQAGIAEYYRRYRDELQCPIVLYEIPGKTNVAMRAETIASLAEDGTIIGMKYSSYDMAEFIRVASAVPDEFALLSGEEPLFASHLAAGAKGGILTTVNAFPEIWVSIYNKVVVEHDLQGALKIQAQLDPLIQAAFSETNPGPLKSILEEVGFSCGKPRLPLYPPAGENLRTIASAVRGTFEKFGCSSAQRVENA